MVIASEAKPFGLEPFGSEFLDTARNLEFIEGLKAEGLMAERQSQCFKNK
jgi:hypothetical protein